MFTPTRGERRASMSLGRWRQLVGVACRTVWLRLEQYRGIGRLRSFGSFSFFFFFRVLLVRDDSEGTTVKGDLHSRALCNSISTSAPIPNSCNCTASAGAPASSPSSRPSLRPSHLRLPAVASMPQDSTATALTTVVDSFAFPLCPPRPISIFLFGKGSLDASTRLLCVLSSPSSLNDKKRCLQPRRQLTLRQHRETFPTTRARSTSKRQKPRLNIESSSPPVSLLVSQVSRLKSSLDMVAMLLASSTFGSCPL